MASSSSSNNGYDAFFCMHQCTEIPFFLQKEAWSGHKRECKCLQSLLPRLPTDSVRLAARLIFGLVCCWTFPLFNSVKLNVHKESCLIPFLLFAITVGKPSAKPEFREIQCHNVFLNARKVRGLHLGQQ